jgi:hypothetical protein
VSKAFFSLLPYLREVVQQARPSHNPRGTCWCWSKSPSAPGGAIPRYQQFQSTREGKIISALNYTRCPFAKFYLRSSLRGTSHRPLILDPLDLLILCRCKISKARQNLAYSSQQQIPFFRSREKGERRPREEKETKREARPEEDDAPNFLKDSDHVPGETPHVPQETPHNPQGTPHEPQAVGRVSQVGS